jgi:hypothetical protein
MARSGNPEPEMTKEHRFGSLALHASRRGVRFLGKATLFLLLMAPALVVIEGVASVFYAARQAWQNFAWQADSERAYTRYDRDLGWVALPWVRLPDFYGPRRTLTTNGRGFRGAREVEVVVPAGRQRILCLGDSFTLGFGVGDEDAWCHLLETMDARRESVNMGGSGYGLDQAWLWYRRDGRALQHQVLFFAFIFDDFRRMLSRDWDGYGKPVLRVERGALKVENVPVPRSSYLLPLLTQNARLLRGLRSVTLLDEILGRTKTVEQDRDNVLDALPLALHVFEDLAEWNRTKGSVLELVFLPDCGEDLSPQGIALRAALARETAQRGLRFVDLVPAMCGQPSEVVTRYFINRGGPVPGIPGHYSRAGHRFVAGALDAQLRAMSGRPDGVRQR